MAAPSAVNQQPWEFYVVTDKAVLEKLAAASPYAAMTAKAQNYSSETNWLVLTDTKYYFTAVFKGSRGNWELVRFIYCAVGKKSSKTRKGSYRMKKKKPYFYYSKYRCKWASKYSGPYYYHSVLYDRSGKKILDGRLARSPIGSIMGGSVVLS